MALMHEPVRRGKVYSGGGDLGTGIATPSFGAPGTGARFGGAANLEAFTDTRWTTIRDGKQAYPSRRGLQR
jgi:hypothetical protein